MVRILRKEWHLRNDWSMRNYQVWLRGCDLNDVGANSEKEAREYIRKFYGFKRPPKGTAVIEIPPGYYMIWWRTIGKLEFQYGTFSNILGSILYTLTPKILKLKPKNQVKSTC